MPIPQKTAFETRDYAVRTRQVADSDPSPKESSGPYLVEMQTIVTPKAEGSSIVTQATRDERPAMIAEQLAAATTAIRACGPLSPDIGIVLGSGLGSLAD